MQQKDLTKALNKKKEQSPGKDTDTEKKHENPATRPETLFTQERVTTESDNLLFGSPRVNTEQDQAMQGMAQQLMGPASKSKDGINFETKKELESFFDDEDDATQGNLEDGRVSKLEFSKLKTQEYGLLFFSISGIVLCVMAVPTM